MNQRKTSRRVLGIDPGFDRLGLAILEGEASSPRHIWSACVTPPKGETVDRLAYVYKIIEKTVRSYRPTMAIVETLFFSKNRKTALSVAQARGAILAALGTEGVPVVELSPGQIKIAVTGYGSADKGAVARMVPKLVELPPAKRLDDEFDALASAIAGLSKKTYPQ